MTFPIPVVQALQVLTVLIAAPGINGVIAKVEARLQGRRGPRLLQPYFDIAKLFRKEALAPLGASWVFLAAPLIAMTCCVGVAAVAPLWIRVVIAGLNPIVPRDVAAGALASDWVLQPVYSEFSALSPSWLAVAMPVLLVGVLGMSIAFGRGRMFAVRRVPAWRSATGGVAGDNQYTPFGFANPTRKVLANLLLTRSELTVLEGETGGAPMTRPATPQAPT
jgi:hydrogenase-4 component B